MSFFWWFLKGWTQKSKSSTFTYLTPSSLSHVGICFPLPPKKSERNAFLWGKMYHLVPYPRYNSPIAGPSWQPSKTSTIGTCFDQPNLRNDAWRAWETAAFWAPLWGHDMICGHEIKHSTTTGFVPNFLAHKVQHDSINQESPSSPRWPTFLLLDLDRPCQVWHHESDGFYHCDFSISWWPNCFGTGKKWDNTTPIWRNITRWTRAQKWSSEDVQKWWLDVISRYAGRTCPLKTGWDKWWYMKQLCMVK